jgi:hypothetical protein
MSHHADEHPFSPVVKSLLSQAVLAATIAAA